MSAATLAATPNERSQSLEARARGLIQALGIDGAIYVCRSNYWHGLLRHVLAYRGPDYPLHPTTAG